MPEASDYHDGSYRDVVSADTAVPYHEVSQAGTGRFTKGALTERMF